MEYELKKHQIPPKAKITEPVYSDSEEVSSQSSPGVDVSHRYPIITTHVLSSPQMHRAINTRSSVGPANEVRRCQLFPTFMARSYMDNHMGALLAGANVLPCSLSPTTFPISWIKSLRRNLFARVTDANTHFRCSDLYIYKNRIPVGY